VNLLRTSSIWQLLLLIIIAALIQLGIPSAEFDAVIGAAGSAIGLALQAVRQLDLEFSISYASE